MGEQADLNQSEAVEKIRHIAKDEIAMVHTFAKGNLGSARPMATAGVDEDGTLWFLSQAASQKNDELRANDAMQVTYTLKARSEYLVLDGHGEVLHDQLKLDELWSAIDKTWFPGGKADPAVSLIRFTASVGHYWDTKHSKMVQLLGMAVGAVTGKATDDSLDGELQP